MPKQTGTGKRELIDTGNHKRYVHQSHWLSQRDSRRPVRSAGGTSRDLFYLNTLDDQT